MSKTSAKVLRALKYLSLSVGIVGAWEVAVLCVGYWLHFQIPFGVTLGLMMGVIAYFASKLTNKGSAPEE
jgi:hypothetical protein